MASSSVSHVTGYNIPTFRNQLYNVTYKLRLKSVIGAFIAVQLTIGLFCLYKINNVATKTNGHFSGPEEETREKIRNLRQIDYKMREFVHEGTKPSTTTTTTTTKRALPLCPLVPPGLLGKLKIVSAPYELERVETMHPELKEGGHYTPTYCTSRHRVAIIIPYRNRKEHLTKLMHILHGFLQRQQLDYGIYVVEVVGLSDFNRALSLNIGFVEASKEYDYQCFIFHDVDLIPENDHNLYTCPDSPRHMSVAVDKMHYKLPYDHIFGGVVAMRKEHFLTVNGFSNKFFGWGGEDDDMYRRLNITEMKISRYKPSIARYLMLYHRKNQIINSERFYLLKHTNDTWKTDGLNTLKYTLMKIERHRLFTYILVDIDPKDPVYFTDRKEIVEESLRKMREDHEKYMKMYQERGNNSPYPSSVTYKVAKLNKTRNSSKYDNMELILEQLRRHNSMITISPKESDNVFRKDVTNIRNKNDGKKNVDTYKDTDGNEFPEEEMESRLTGLMDAFRGKDRLSDITVGIQNEAEHVDHNSLLNDVIRETSDDVMIEDKNDVMNDSDSVMEEW